MTSDQSTLNIDDSFKKTIIIHKSVFYLQKIVKKVYFVYQNFSYFYVQHKL